DGLHLGRGVLLGDPFGEHPRGEVVALADRGAEDQDSHRQPRYLGGRLLRRMSGPRNQKPTNADAMRIVTTTVVTGLKMKSAISAIAPVIPSASRKRPARVRLLAVVTRNSFCWRRKRMR